MGWLLKRNESETAEADAASDAPDHPALAGLGEPELEAVRAASQVRKFAPGDVLAEAGLPDPALFLVLEGEVGLLCPRGDRLDLAGTVGPGGTVGGPVHPARPPRSTAAVARGGVTCLVLAAEDLAALPEGPMAALSRGLAAVADGRAEALLTREAETAGRTLAVARRARALLEQRQAVCEGSDMVKKIVAGVPALPMYASRLAAVLQEDQSSASDVVGLAKLDPSLAAVVLKTVNSPYYNLQNKVTDLQHAVVLLGFDQVYQLVMAAGMATTMPNTPEFRELQLHANAVSFIAMEVGRLAGVDKPASLATLGLLHDIGMSVVLLLKEQYPHLAVFLGMLEPGKLGSMLLERWQIPPAFCQAVMYQHHPDILPPDELPESCRNQTAALYVAHLCYDHLRGRSESELPVLFLPEYLEAAGLQAPDLETLVRRRLLPALAQRRANFPEPMRRFFTECENRLGPR